MSPTFQPPTIDDVPPLLGDEGPYVWPGGPVEYRLFGHYKNRARGQTIILKTDGTCTAPLSWPAQMVSQDNATFSVFAEQGLAGIPYTQIHRVFTGGHIYPINATEAAQLTAAGYGAGITP